MGEREPGKKATLEGFKRIFGRMLDQAIMKSKDSTGKSYTNPRDAYRFAAREIPLEVGTTDNELVITTIAMEPSETVKITRLYAELLSEIHGIDILEAMEIVQLGVIEGLTLGRKMTIPTAISETSSQTPDSSIPSHSSFPPPMSDSFKTGGQYGPSEPIKRDWSKTEPIG